MSKKLRALSTFQTNHEVWLQGQTKITGDNQAAELLKAGLAEEVVENGETEAAQEVEVSPSATPLARETKPAKRTKKEIK